MIAAAPPTAAVCDGVARLRRAAVDFGERLARGPAPRALPVEDHAALARASGTLRREVEWRNRLLCGPGIRRAHVEFFAIEGQIGVLHVCVFPEFDTGRPIFGFDVISGVEKTTGVFLDLSPTTPEAAPCLEVWGRMARDAAESLGDPRVLPDWGDIFGPDAVAVRPRAGTAVEAAIALAGRGLSLALAGGAPCDPAEMRAAQARYVAGQTRNPHTRRMLAGCVGDALADAFIAEVLFPHPDRVEQRSRAALQAITR